MFAAVAWYCAAILGTTEQSPAAAMIVDTSMQYPLLLDDGGWKKAGVDAKSLALVEGMKDLRAWGGARIATGCI